MNILKYNVDFKRHSKRLYLALAALLILISALIYFQFNQSKVQSDSNLSVSASILAQASGFEDGTPFSLLDLQTNQTQVIIAGEKTNLKPGKYRISLISDFAGTKTQEVELKANQELKLELQDTSKELQGPQSASKLKAATSTDRAVDFTQIKATQNFSPASQSANIGKLSLAALPQNNFSNPGDTSNLANPNGVQNVAALQPTTDQLNSPTQNLFLKNTEGLQYIAKNCTFAAVDLVAQTGNVRYFKDCQSNNQDGFFEYDSKSKTEKLLLATSNPINQAYVAIHPTNSETVFTRPETGEFGFSDSSGIQIIAKDAFYYAPAFSPDGKSVLVTKATSAADSKASQFSTIFKQEIIKFDYQDLKQNKAKAAKTGLGATYFVPRGFEPNYRFYQWQDLKTFKAGDSDAVFSLESGVLQAAKSEQPGKFYSDSTGKTWRVYQFRLFDEQNNLLADKVTGVYQTSDQQTWFAIDGYLSRIVAGQLVLVYPKPIAAALPTSQGLTLLLSDGNQVKLAK